MRRLPLIVMAAVLAAPAYAEPPAPLAPAPNLKSVAHLQWNGGTDLEFYRAGSRRYVVAGSQNNYNAKSPAGLRVVDVTVPTKPKVVGFLPCNTSQNDIQVRGHLAFIAVDFNARGSTVEPDCFTELDISPRTGVVVVDLANVTRPRAIGFFALKTGAHNTTVHPTKPILYVSESETDNLDDPLEPVYVVDFSNPRQPKQVAKFDLGPGNSPHDITFNKSGSRAYVAAGFTGQTFIVDTSKPTEPAVVSRIEDQAINFAHQADPTPDGKYLLITDELAGAEGNSYCPGGGVHVWDISNELAPVKVGAYFIPDTFATADPGPRPNIVGAGPTIYRCTAHVMRMTPDGKTLVMGWYSQGVQVLDLTGLAGVSVGVGVAGSDKGVGIKRLGSWTQSGVDTWSAKMDDRNYIFTGDTQRGFDVVKFVRSAKASPDPGLWLTPQQALFRGLRDKALQPARTYFCFERLTRLGL